MKKRLLLGSLCGLACLWASCATTNPSGTSQEHVSFSGFITSSEFVTGRNRFPFILVSKDGETLDENVVDVRFSRLVEDELVPGPQGQAVWHQLIGSSPHRHSDGELHLHLDFRGVYVVEAVSFDDPGLWTAEFEINDGDNGAWTVKSAGFNVRAEPLAVGVGQRVPATENLTIKEVEFSALSSRLTGPDELHNLSVAQALEKAKPFVVSFASPAFCTSAMCGPVVESLDLARQALGSVVEIIHIEPWNLEIARKKGKLVPAPVMKEWGLTTEPWTFVVGPDGRVSWRFEGLVSATEIVSAVKQIID